MIVRKTGWYSGRGPCQCGALIAGASTLELEGIGSFGEALGMGFQIRDDLLNLTADSEHQSPTSGAGGYGKERGGDFAEGKRTLIVIELLERLPALTIAVTQGECAGGGLQLALACDIRYAQQGARMGVPFVKLGMHPGMAGTHLLPMGNGLVICRETGRLPETVKIGEKKSGRWDRFDYTLGDKAHTNGHHPLSVGALGQDGWRQVRARTQSGLPEPVRLGLPALWSGDEILAVAHLKLTSNPHGPKWAEKIRFSTRFSPLRPLQAEGLVLV